MTDTAWILTAMSINMNGLKSNMRTKLKELHKQRKDIILIQETKIKEKQDVDNLCYTWAQVSHGTAYCTAAAANISGGVAILLSHHATSLLTDIRLTL